MCNDQLCKAIKILFAASKIDLAVKMEFNKLSKKLINK